MSPPFFGHNSSNTKKLKKVADDRGIEAHHIQNAEQLQREWFTGKTHVGITGGTSTPHSVISEVRQAIEVMTEGQ